MDRPFTMKPYKAGPEITVLPSYVPIPGLGMVPVNTFVLKAAEPVLVDSGLIVLREEFPKRLSVVIDPRELKWLWLTHADADHIGGLRWLVDTLPGMRVVTSFMGLGRMSLSDPLAPQRAFLINPGQTLDVGDRTLTAVRPPTYDSAETTGFYDSRSKAFFSADCFGAFFPEPVEDAAELAEEELGGGMTTWTTLDSPWVHITDAEAFSAGFEAVRLLAPDVILSSHLPVARGMTEKLLRCVEAARSAKPFVGPDQAALKKMMAGAAAG